MIHPCPYPRGPRPTPLDGSPRLVPWHPRLPPRREAGQWRPRQTILARPSLTIARMAALRLGRRPGALMRSSPPPPLPPPHAATFVDPTRPSLPSRTYIRPPSTQYRGPGPERVGPQATLLHPPCTNPMASPLWVDGRWMGDLKEPAGGGGRGERHHCCRLLLSTPLCPLVALALLCSSPLHSYPYLYSPLTSLLLASWLVCLGAGSIGLLPNSSRLS